MGRHAKPATWATIDADEAAAAKSAALGYTNGRYAGKHARGLAQVAYSQALKRVREAARTAQPRGWITYTRHEG